MSAFRRHRNSVRSAAQRCGHGSIQLVAIAMIALSGCGGEEVPPEEVYVFAPPPPPATYRAGIFDPRLCGVDPTTGNVVGEYPTIPLDTDPNTAVPSAVPAVTTGNAKVTPTLQHITVVNVDLHGDSVKGKEATDILTKFSVAIRSRQGHEYQYALGCSF